MGAYGKKQSIQTLADPDKGRASAENAQPAPARRRAPESSKRCGARAQPSGLIADMKPFQGRFTGDAFGRGAAPGYIRELSICALVLIIAHLRAAQRAAPVIKHLDRCGPDCIIGFGFIRF